MKTDTAVDCTHGLVWSDGTKSLTRWTDIKSKARWFETVWKAQGAYFVKTFKEPSNILGGYRVVAHFKADR
jgi:hypothetical protein